MKKQKIISAVLSVTMMSTLLATLASAEDITVSSVVPADKANAVSVVKDVSLTFSTELDSGLLTKENFSVTSKGKVPDYEVSKSGKTVKLCFADEFDYDTDYTVTLKNVGVDKSFNFTTEQDPVNVLFEEDFSTLTNIEERFTNTGAARSQWGGSYDIDTTGKSLRTGGSWSKNVGGGPMATVKGSESWIDYEVYGEFKNRPDEMLGIIALRQTVDTTTASNQTNDGYFVTAGSYYKYIADSTGMTLSLTKAETAWASPTFTTADEHPAVTNETFYGVNVSVVGNKIDAKTIDLTTKNVMNSFSYTDEAKTYTKGALSFGALNTFTYWDNIKVTDKGLRFTPDKIKNTGSTIRLTFNEALDESSVTDDKITIKDESGIVASAIKVIDNKNVDVAIASPELDTEYTITVSKDILRASDGLGMNNDKTFKILTSENEDEVTAPEITVPIALVSVTPTDGTKDVSIFEDPVISFSTELDESSLSGKIAVTREGGSVPDFTVVKDGKNAVVKFEKELDYETTYNVVVNTGIKNIYGGETQTGKNFSFTTERDEMDILFEEDFNTLTDVNEKFTNTGEQDHRYSISGKALNVGEHHEWAIGQGPIATIKGSDNWTDYEVYGEFKTRQYASGVIAFRQQVDTTSASDQSGEGYFLRAGAYDRIYIDGQRTEANRMHLDLNAFDSNMTPYVYTDTYPEISNETFYGVTLDVEGNKINAHTTDLATGETLNTLSYTDTTNKYTKGAIGFGVYYDWTYWDNIKVVDKGLTFKPARVKNTSNSINLLFNKPIAESSITNDKITVKKGDTTVDSTVTVVNDTTVNIQIKDIDVSTYYTITVSKDILRASDNLGMNSDKTFKILTSSNGLALEPIEVVSITPVTGGKNVDIFTDPVVRFTSEPTLESVKEHISVTSKDGTVPKYTIKVDGNDVTVEFKKELDYEETYTVTVAKGIENETGAATANGTATTFTTERNEMNILFEEDFNSLTDITEKFINTGWQDKKIGLEGGSLYIQNPWSQDIGQSAIATIKGSENWTDYEIYGEFKQRSNAAGVIGIRQSIDTSSASNQTGTGFFIRAGKLEAETDGMHLDITKYGNSYASPEYASASEHPEVTNESFYGVTVSAVGNQIDAHTTNLKTGETMNSVSYTDTANTYKKGAVSFMSLRDFTYWDNIKVIDKGFGFKPTQMKNVAGSFSLDFTNDVNEETLAQNIVVTDKDGKAMQTRVTLDGTKKVDVVVEDAADGAVYTVTVKNAVADTDGNTLANDKTFDIKVVLAFAVEEIYLADADGKATELTADGTVKGIAKVNHRDGEQSYTVVIAVYDETGAMYDVLFETVDKPIEGTNTIETKSIKLPKDITGYKASVFLMDNLKNIKPLTGKVSVPN